MPVSTKAIIRKGVTLDEIVGVLTNRYGKVDVDSRSDETFYLHFDDGQDKRSLFLYFGSLEEPDPDGVYCSLNCWGNSVEIMRHLCQEFGGYLDEDDCDGEGYYAINSELLTNERELSPIEQFKLEVINKLGYNNLKTAMELLEKYAKING